MKLITAIAVLGLVLGGCSTHSEPETETVLSAFVYDVEPDPDDPYARQLGLSIDACDGDYEVSVDETTDTLRVEVLNHEPTGKDCLDSFTVHLDAPPHGKSVVDETTGNTIHVGGEALP